MTTIYELEAKATPGLLTVDSDPGFWLYLDIEDATQQRGKRVVATFPDPDSEDETIALVKSLAHCRNHFMEALEALKQVCESEHTADHWICIDNAEQLIAKLETVEEI